MENKNETMVQAVVAAVLAAVDDASLLAESGKRGFSEVRWAVTDEALLAEAGRRGLSEVRAVTDAALLAEAQRRGMEFANWSDEGVLAEVERRGLEASFEQVLRYVEGANARNEQVKLGRLGEFLSDKVLGELADERNLLRVNLNAVTQWLEREASGNDKREVADILPPHTLADRLVAGGNADLVLSESDDDDLWEAISDKDWVVQRNIDELDEEALFESMGDGVKEDWCEDWWKNSKRELLAECDDGELWEAIDNKDQYKGEANVEAVERILTDCDTDGLIKALEVVARRLRGW